MIATIKETLEEMIVQKIEEKFTSYQMPDGAVIEEKFTDKLTATETINEEITKRIACLENGIEVRKRRIEEMDNQGSLKIKTLMIYGLPEVDHFIHNQENTAE